MMGKRLKDIDLYSAYDKWRKNTGPFCCYVRAANFVSLKHYTDFELEAVEAEGDLVALYPRLQKIIEGHERRHTLFFMDLPGEMLIRAAYSLTEAYRLKPVITFNSPLHPNGLIGGAGYISALLDCGEAFSDFRPEGYVFLLDNSRYGEYTEEQLRSFFNNQYEITDEDVPPLQMLRDLGYRSLVYIYNGAEKEDIAEYLDYLEQEGFSVIRESVEI